MAQSTNNSLTIGKLQNALETRGELVINNSDARQKTVHTGSVPAVLFQIDDSDVARMEVDSSGNVNFVGAAVKLNGSSIGGSGAVSAVANGADNRIATFSSSDALNGEANLTFDGSTFTVAAATAVNLQTDALSVGENGDTDVVITFNGNTSDGTLTWMEDEGEFRFNSPTKGKFLHYTQHVFNKNSGTSLIYVPLNTTTDQASFEEYACWMAPHDGKLLKVMIRPKGYSSNYGGSTVIGLHINRNGTAATTDTQTLGSDATVTYTFSSSNTFSAGDLLSLSVDVSTAPGDVNLCAIWELDSTT